MQPRAVSYALRAAKTASCRIRQSRDVLYRNTPSCVAFLGCYMDTGRNCMLQCGVIRRVAGQLLVRLRMVEVESRRALGKAGSLYRRGGNRDDDNGIRT